MPIEISLNGKWILMKVMLAEIKAGFTPGILT